MKKKPAKYLCFLVIFGVLVNAPYFVTDVSAALCPYNYLGTVTRIDTETNTIEIQTDLESIGGGSWMSNIRKIQGKAPRNATKEIQINDYIEAASLGSPGDTWVALARMKSPAENVITDIYGDPIHLLSSSLLGGFEITYENVPDCSTWSGGCSCEAEYTIITINRDEHQLDKKNLYPGQTYTYEEEEFRLKIAFYSGEASANPKCTKQLCHGPQPISDFTIHSLEVKAESKKLDVPYLFQGHTPWCMLASATMLLRYYGNETTIWEEGEYLGWDKSEGVFAGAASGTEILLGNVLEKPLLQEKYEYKTEPVIWEHSGPEDMFDYIKRKIKDYQPVMLLSIHEKHAVVIVGYEEAALEGEKYIYVHDPNGDITDEKFGSHFPQENVKVTWIDFYDLLGKDPFGALETKTIVITNGTPDPKHLSLQIQQADLLFEQGKDEFEKGNYETALDCFQEAKNYYLDYGSSEEIAKCDEWIQKTQAKLEEEPCLGSLLIITLIGFFIFSLQMNWIF